MYRICCFIILAIISYLPLNSQDLLVSQAKLNTLTCWQPILTDELPAKISLKKYTPFVGNQGNSNACVGWAIGYGAMTIQKAKTMSIMDKQTITENAFSPDFIYHLIPKESRNERVALIEGIEIIETTGNLKYTAFNSINLNYRTRINSFQKAEAKQNIIPKTTLLFKKENAAAEKINRTKAALAKGYPIVLSMSVRKNFHQLKGGKYWWPHIGNTTPMGGHALVIVAYDDQKQAFQLMNSWGTDWGRDGFVWIKYKDFAQFAKHAFCLSDFK